METRANYVLIGLFTLVVIAGGFGFVYWFRNTGSLGERNQVQVVFEGTVSGLRPGAAVLFNGQRVGEVADLGVDPAAPRQVVATIAVDRKLALRTDTWVGLEYQGLTGIAAVSLRGGSATAPLVTGNPPLLRADHGASQDLAQGAREVLRKLDAFVSENESSMRTSLKNIEVFTNTLANNSDRIERILSGAETLVGSAENKLADVSAAARSVRAAADNLDQRTGDIAAGLTRFSTTGLKEWEKLAVDGRRAIGVLERTVKNIDQNPSRLLFGGAPKPPAAAEANAQGGATGSTRR